MAVATAAAVLVRALPYGGVFTETGVRFSGNDAYYHALRVERTLDDFPRVPVRDSLLGYPDGATIPWPPLFDGAVAWTARLVAGGEGAGSAALRIGAWTPGVLGALTVPATAALGLLLLGPVEGALAALAVAVLPAHATFTRVGDFDQHGAEVLLLVLALVAFAGTWREGVRDAGSRRAEALLAVLLAAAFLVWQGSVLHLGVLGGGLAAAWLALAPGLPLRRRMAASLARSALAGAAILAGAATVLVSPHALLRTSLVGVTGFHVGALLLLAVFAGGLWAASGGGSVGVWPAMGRMAVVSVGCAVLALAAPGFREPVVHGLRALGAATPWHANIQEFDPLFFAGYTPLAREMEVAWSLVGATLLLAPAAVVRLVRRWPASPIARVRVAQLLWLGLGLIPLALMRRRFLVYAAVPLALWAALLAASWGRRLARRWGGKASAGVALALLGIALLPVVPWHLRQARPQGSERQALLDALEWLRSRDPVDPGRPAVLAEWDFGHLIQYVARRPVLVSPFGTDVGEAPMRDFAAAFLTAEPDTLERVLDRRRVGFVLLANPVTEAYFAPAYRPGDTLSYVVAERSWRRGLAVEVLPPFWETAASRLFFEDGSGRDEGPEAALDHLRLIWESATASEWEGRRTPALKLFEWVPGAVLEVRGAAPSTPVVAETALVTAAGRTARWATTAQADQEGVARVRVPYATGAEGSVRAVTYRVTSGRRTGRMEVSEADVRGGLTRVVALTAPR